MESLQNLCLQAIVQEFETFYIAFSKCDATSLKRNFEFLRRVYSNEIASRLFKKLWFEKKITGYILVPKYYVDFLINKYLKYLDTKWLKDCSWPTIAAKFAEIGSNLETVHFGFKKKPWLHIICNLSHLQRVIYPRGCNDEFLEGIANFCPNVVEMDVTCSPNVTDTGIKYLCMKQGGKVSCPKLKKLYIERTRVTDEGVAHVIQNLRSLEETDYRYLPELLYSLHKNDLSALDRIEPYNLKRLYLLGLHEEPFFADLLKICITLCPRLKSFSCPIITEDHFALFSGLNELKHLRLQCPIGYYVDLLNLIKLKGEKLKSLFIDNLPPLFISTFLECCPSLTSLWINVENPEDSDEDSGDDNFQNSSNIASVPNKLKTCFNNSATSQSLSSKLEEIVIDGCLSYSNEWKSDFLMCCEHYPLKKICFSNCLFDMTLVKDILVNCRSLKYLSFYDWVKPPESYEIEFLPNSSKVYTNDKSCLKSYYDHVDDFYENGKDFQCNFEEDDDNDDYDDDDDVYHYHHNAYRSYFQLHFSSNF